MIRLLLAVPALVATLLVATPLEAQPRDWTQTVTPTPRGAFVVGNAAAPVRLIEYMSYTCSHCADFARSGAPLLMRDHVRTGRVSFEIRNMLLNGLDFTAALAVRCGGPARFKGHHDAIFANQAAITRQGAGFDPAKYGGNITAVARAWARRSGIAALMAKRGVPAAALDKCLGDTKVQAALQAMTEEGQRRGVQGTPTFFIGDRKLDANEWAAIEPELRKPTTSPKAG